MHLPDGRIRAAAMLPGMRRTNASAAVLLALALAGCASTAPSSSDAAPSSASPTPSTATSPAAKASASASSSPAAITAATVARTILRAVPQAKQVAVYTDATDPNHLLGRPHEYTSKVEFSDSRIHGAAVQGQPPGSLQYGASVEVFADSMDAGARMASIQANAASQPAIMEYDYIHGNVLVRVSHYLTPRQAADYDKAAAAFG